MDDAVPDELRPHLLASAAGLQDLLLEASTRVTATEPGSEQRQRWQAALDTVLRALDETEQVTGRVLPDLGRRDWTARPVPQDRTAGRRTAAG